MEIQQDWDKTKLEHYLLSDSWESAQAMIILSGYSCEYGRDRYGYPVSGTYLENRLSINFNRESFKPYMTLDKEAYSNTSKDEINKLESDYERLLEIWDSNTTYRNHLYPPAFFIDWALSKRFRPDWLDWAIDKGLYTPKEPRNLPATIQNTPAAPEFDKASPTYPPELALALEAWRAVSTTEGKGKPKARIKAWLNTNTTLSEKAKIRITVVCNWEKQGGATTTE